MWFQAGKLRYLFGVLVDVAYVAYIQLSDNSSYLMI